MQVGSSGVRSAIKHYQITVFITMYTAIRTINCKVNRNV
jgi:hypothetical protein